jgi:hypothetical protein
VSLSPDQPNQNAADVADAIRELAGERVPLRHGLAAVIIRDPKARARRGQTLYLPHSRTHQRVQREARRVQQGGRSA